MSTPTPQAPAVPVRPSLFSVLPVIRAALAEDIGPLDITSEAIVPVAARAKGRFLAKAEGVICGLWVCELVFAEINPAVRFEALVEEAARVSAGQDVALVSGQARAILGAERVALNFLQRLSGIATMAYQASSAVAGTKTRILDTRKTTPGLRALEKYAVRAGGASNHRFGLFDMVLIKDNHIRLAGGIKPAVIAARRNAGPALKIEVECGDLAQVGEALEAGADVIMLDNMGTAAMGQAVRLIGGRALVEASGGVTISDLAAVAGTGVDFVSMGALTHSYRSLDISLELELSGDGPAGA